MAYPVSYAARCAVHTLVSDCLAAFDKDYFDFSEGGGMVRPKLIALNSKWLVVEVAIPSLSIAAIGATASRISRRLYGRRR